MSMMWRGASNSDRIILQARVMLVILILLFVIVLIGCSNKQMGMKETITAYYDHMLNGKMEESQNLLDWDSEEWDIVDYYVKMPLMNKDYGLISLETFEISSSKNDDASGEAVVKITYKDKVDKNRIEINTLELHTDSNDNWKITSITRKME